MSATIKKGEERAYAELREAVSRNCTCPMGNLSNSHPHKCEPCKMLTDDKALHRMMFARTLRLQIETEEWRDRERFE